MHAKEFERLMKQYLAKHDLNALELLSQTLLDVWYSFDLEFKHTRKAERCHLKEENDELLALLSKVQSLVATLKVAFSPSSLLIIALLMIKTAIQKQRMRGGKAEK